MSRPTYCRILVIIAACLIAVSCAPAGVPATQPTSLPLATISASPTTEPPTVTLPPTVTPQPTVPPPTETQLPPTATTAPSPTSVPATPAPTHAPTAFATDAKEPGGEHDWEVTAVPPTSGAVASPTQSSGSTGSSLDAIIPPGKGRELLFNNCTSCHSFVCSVIGQRTKGNWQTIRTGHADRVPSLTEEDQDVLFAYLLENFGDQKPEPELPPELKEQGCSAQ